MESPSTFKAPPVDTYTPADECADTKRLNDGVDDLLGAVVVGGRYSADCFRYGERMLQAGVKDPEPEMPMYDEDGQYKWTPRKLPW